MTIAAERQRLDKWLWFARFFKTRSLAARSVSGGKVRLNGVHATKPSAGLSVGDVLTFAQGRRVRVVEVAALGLRRGPASEAAQLYLDRSPLDAPDGTEPGAAPAGARPTKRARRLMERAADAARASNGVDPVRERD